MLRPASNSHLYDQDDALDSSPIAASHSSSALPPTTTLRIARIASVEKRDNSPASADATGEVKLSHQTVFENHTNEASSNSTPQSSSSSSSPPVHSAPRHCELCGYKYRIEIQPEPNKTVCSIKLTTPSAAAAAAASNPNIKLHSMEQYQTHVNNVTYDAISTATPAITAQPESLVVTTSCVLAGALNTTTSTTAASTASSSSSSSSSSSTPNTITSGIFRCSRCGLITHYDMIRGTTLEVESADLNCIRATGDELCRITPPEQSCLMEAARAYKFVLSSACTPLIKDLAQIVVDYLLWYRSSEDFRVGDLIDCRDLRGKWLLSRVDDISNGKLLVHFIGYSSRWDQWISSQSDALAPCHTKSKESTNSNRKLQEANSWKSSTVKKASMHHQLQQSGTSSGGVTSEPAPHRFEKPTISSVLSSAGATAAAFSLPATSSFSAPSSSLSSSSMQNGPNLDVAPSSNSSLSLPLATSSGATPTPTPPVHAMSSRSVDYDILNRPAPSKLLAMPIRSE